jgi:Uncharacterized protein conserved in bacteria
MNLSTCLWARGRVLTTLLLITLALSLVLPPAPAVQAQEAPIEQMRAFWVDSLSPGFHNHPQVDELIDNMLRAKANTLFVQMRRHGNAWYNNGIEPRAIEPGLAPAEEFDPLAYILEKAHLHGIKVHAWLVISVTCRSSDRLWGHPDHICTSHGPTVRGAERWTTATYGGTQVGDLDMGHPSAINHIENVVTTLIQNYPALDGIHYDFIRYAGESYGYNQVSVDRYNQAYGKPAGYRPPPGEETWKQWRRDRMTELVRRLYIRIKSLDPQMEVSAATITWGGLGSYTPDDWPNSSAYNTVFQDWKAWLQEGIIDFAVPMHYFSESNARHRSWYDSWMRWDRDNVGKRAIVSGIGSWLNSAEGNIAQIQRAIQPDEQGRALAGVAFFAYSEPIAGSNSARRRAFMDQLGSTIFAQPAQAPNWPWIANPTTGMIQGIATIDGEVLRAGRVTLIRDGEWVKDISISYDGWFGSVELEPGTYTVVIQHPDGRTVELMQPVHPGLVTSF